MYWSFYRRSGPSRHACGEQAEILDTEFPVG